MGIMRYPPFNALSLMSLSPDGHIESMSPLIQGRTDASNDDKNSKYSAELAELAGALTTGEVKTVEALSHF